ncbi:MAG: pyruvate formate lyase-activating protein [Chloroflexi bacterium]|nr:pyruvate formate lyase-activating protein [Chloroflexota bacterium]
MRILALDIGAGTQDILLFDSAVVPTNWIKMVMPSPTVIVAGRIEAATKRSEDILLTGVTMGGGACASALKRHLQCGRKAFATSDAARTFDDDLAEVEKLGVAIVDDREAERIEGATAIDLKDLDLEAISSALAQFGIEPRFHGVAVAVLDHGAAPPGVSDRVFRFDHIQGLVAGNNGLTAFAQLGGEVPTYLTRMKAIVESFTLDIPLLLMDTPAAAALGALQDARVSQRRHRLMVNCGNAHTLGFHMRDDAILGLFEHHTGCLNTEKLDQLITRLSGGQLSRREVFDDGGHGACVVTGSRTKPFLAVTGPRRRLLAGSALQPYFAVPHGDMMLAGPFGLVRAFAEKIGAWKDEIIAALAG